jgi:enamine deaminase RidA (YjgF/YER057c/UK114 family)
VRIGNVVHVAGTTAVGAGGKVVGPGDAYTQTLQALRIIEAALIEAGATMRDVVRTRLYVTDITKWEDIGRAHGQFFRDVRPASTMVEVKRLIDPELMVEVEVEAVIQNEA